MINIMIINNIINNNNHDKYITTPTFERLTIANFVKTDSFDGKRKTKQKWI